MDKNFTFQFGDTKKYTVDFNMSKWSGDLKIFIDGKEVQHFHGKMISASLPIAITHEGYKIKFQLETPTFLGFIRKTKVQVWVNDKPLATY